MLSGDWPVVGNALALATRDGRTAGLAPHDQKELAEGGWADEVRTGRPVKPLQRKRFPGAIAEVGQRESGLLTTPR